MNKKAFLESYADLLGWVVLIIGIIMWLIIITFTNLQVKSSIKEKVEYLNNEEILISILKSEVNSKETYSDLIVNSYINKKDDVLKTYTQETLDPVFGKLKSVCWRIYINDELFSKEDCGDILSEPFLDSSVILPLPKYFHEDTITLRIEVPGFVR
ncbi:hypothetical protein JXB41_01530 [Candidatus Woesearchaeota archaeon]|nr:hypothetical protein [Candidatus Woesearchaeota archaeon]